MHQAIGSIDYKLPAHKMRNYYALNFLIQKKNVEKKQRKNSIKKCKKIS